MATRKYLKFGLRADKNLADLTNPNTALANVLNDLSSEVDAEGVPTGFRVSDIAPLRAFTESDLDETYDYTTPEIPPYALTRLKGTRPEATIILGDGVTVTRAVEPQITMQDYLNKFKAVFGDPPFVNGGSGPTAYKIATNRLRGKLGNRNVNPLPEEPGTSLSGNNMTAGNRYRIDVIGSGDDFNTIAGTTSQGYQVDDIFTATIDAGSAYANSTVTNVTLPSSNGSVGAFADADASNLPPYYLYTNKEDVNLDDIVIDPDDWTSGDFFINGRIIANFPNANGAIVWEGYQDSGFEPTIVTNGLYLVEQDVTGNPDNNDNWEFLRGTLQTQFQPFSDVSIETPTGDNRTKITFTNIDDYKRLAVGMKVKYVPPGQITLDDEDQTAQENVIEEMVRPDDNTAHIFLDQNLSETVAATKDVTFSFSPGEDLLTYRDFRFQAVGFGGRRRVRWTVVWPDGTSLTSQKQVENTSSVDFTYTRFYKTPPIQDFSEQRYSYPYFRANKASALVQESDHELKVPATLKNKYEPKLKSTDIAFNHVANIATAGYGKIQPVRVALQQGGICFPEDKTHFNGISLGDHIIFYAPNSQYYDFKVREIIDSTEDNPAVQIDPSFSTKTNMAEGVYHPAIILKNQGLVGVYTHSASLGLQRFNTGGDFAPECTLVQEDDLLYKIDFRYSVTPGGSAYVIGDGDTPVDVNNYGFRITGTDHENTNFNSTNFTIEANPDVDSQNNSNISSHTSDPGFVAIYAAKGLVDKSTVQECVGVVGKEAVVQANIGTNVITLSDVLNISAGNHIQLDGSIPTGTTISSINSSTNQVTISNNIAALDVVKGSTIVIVDHTHPTAYDPSDGTTVIENGYGGANKEYCIIPLNTAPPWEGTTLGLKTPPNHSNLVTKELRFTKMSFTLPTNNIEELSTSGVSTQKYIGFKYTEPG